MTERYSGAAARVSLKVGSGQYIDHDAATGRTGLTSAIGKLATTKRVLPGGYSVTLPMLVRSGTARWTVVRTVATDQQLCGASQQTGTLRLRPQGTGSGLPQAVVPVVIGADLAMTNSGTSIWTVTVTVAGPINRTPQT